MRYTYYLMVALTIFGCADLHAQHPQDSIVNAGFSWPVDIIQVQSISKAKDLKRLLVPPLLFTMAGLYSMSDNDLLNRFSIQEERNEWMPVFRHRADDYLQYAPIAIVYGLNIAGIEGKNDFGNRTAILIKTEMLVGAVTYSLKKLTAVPRPDTGQPTSFPSGHTAQAFAAATFMAKEYGNRSIWYSIGAYIIATGVGAMRMMNNRHWVSDVLVGAGIGILSTNIVYLTHQYRWGKKNRTNSGLFVSPTYSQRSFCLFISAPIR